MALSARFRTFCEAMPPMTGSACLATISTLSCDTPRTPFVMPMDRRNFDLGSGAMSSRVELPLPSSLGGGVPTSSAKSPAKGSPEDASASDGEVPPMGMEADPVRTRSLRDLAVETGAFRTLTHRSRRPLGARDVTSRDESE